MASGKTYSVNILVRGRDQASKPLGRIGRALRNVGTIITGITAANLFFKLGQGIKNLGGAIFSSVADYERMAFSLESLVARELTRGKVQEQVSRSVQQLTKQERLDLALLQDSYKDVGIQVGVASKRYEDLVNSQGENATATLMAGVELEKLNTKYFRHGQALDGLKAKNGQMVESIKLVRVGTMSMAEALKNAGPRAKELLGWVEQLAIASPFDVKSVNTALRTAMAYGLGSKQAQRMTQALVDFSAAAGLNEEVLGRVARAMGQIQGKGKLMAEEVRQMADAGIPVLQIMADHYEITTAEVQKLMRKGLIPANEALEAITASLEGDFGGAAERQLETWAGIKNSFGDIKSLGMQRVFSGLFEAFKPFFTMFIQFMRVEGFDRLKAFGDTLAIWGEQVSGDLLTKLENLRWILQDIGLMAQNDQIGGGLRETFEFEPSPAAVEALAKIRVIVDWWRLNGEETTQKIKDVIGAFLTFQLVKGVVGIVSGIAGAMAALTLPLGLVLLAITGIALAWGKWGEDISLWVSEKYETLLKPALLDLGERLAVSIPTAIDTFKRKWFELGEKMTPVVNYMRDEMTPIFQTFSDNLGSIWSTGLATFAGHWNTLKEAIVIIGDYWRDILAPVGETLALLFEERILPVIEAVSLFINDFFLPAWTLLSELFRDSVLPLFQELSTLLDEVILFVLRKIRDYLRVNFIPVWEKLWKKISSVIGLGDDMEDSWASKLGPLLAEWAENLLPKLSKGFDKIATALGNVTEWVKGLITYFQDLREAIPEDLLPGSPPPLAIGLMRIKTVMDDFGKTGLSPLTNTLTGSGISGISGDINSGASGASSNRNNEYHFNFKDTTLDQDTLIQVLEDINTDEGNM